jgi:hypothetical protein
MNDKENMINKHLSHGILLSYGKNEIMPLSGK